jgi:uncharacterized protein YdhG (YjbR/CyaY superfamily)
VKKARRPGNFETINDYIAAQAPAIRPALKKIQQIIRKTVPGAVEGISYQMPVFKFHGVLMYFAVFTNHYSVFFRPVHLDKFRGDLGEFRTTKSAINIPLTRNVPAGIITRIAKHAARQNLLKAQGTVRRTEAGIRRKG